MVEICKIVLDRFAIPAEWALSIAVPIYEGKGDNSNCRCYRAVKHLEHGM